MNPLGNVEYVVVDKFCYFDDMLSACGGAEASSISHIIRLGWKKFRELTSGVFLHKIKEKLYSACVTSVMLYGSKTWPLKERDISRIAQADMQMVQWMCHISLRDRKSSEVLRNSLGIANITDVLCQTRLRRLGHFREWIKKTQSITVGLLTLAAREGKEDYEDQES